MPMPSKTLAARMSAASRACMSNSSVLRMMSGSLPSITSCRPFCKNGSASNCISRSSPSNPWRREMLLQSMILPMTRARSRDGARSIHGNISSARFMTSIGVCTQMAATVPTTTIMNAAEDTSAWMPAPLRMAPRMIAIAASSRPVMLRTSTAEPLVVPLGQLRLQAQQRLPMQLTDARFGDFEHRADLFQVQLLLVIQRQHQALALGQHLYRLDDGLAQRLVEGAGLGIRRAIGQAIERGFIAVVGIVQAQQLAAEGVLHDALVLGQRYAHMRGDVGLVGLRAALRFDFAQRLRRGPGLAMHRARRPVELAQGIEHGAANANAGVSLETRAASGGVVLRSLEQPHHAGLHQVLDFHLRGQTPRQVIGDALDQIGVLAHQRVHVWHRLRTGVGARAGVHFTTFRRAARRRSIRARTNSRRPLAPSG